MSVLLPGPCRLHAAVLRRCGNAAVLRRSERKTFATVAQAEHQGARRHSSRKHGVKTDRGVSSSTTPSAGASLQTSAPPSRSLHVLSRYRALVVDAAYRPIDVVNWQRAVCMDLMEKADVLEYYDGVTVCSPSVELFLPAVMKARWYGGAHAMRVAFNRRNILLRDKLCCQYCGRSGGASGPVQLTLDHVVPASKGGQNTWENLVAACAPCNTKKGDKTLKQLGWRLKKEPKEPSPWEMDIVLSSVGAGDLKNVPEEWSNYLFFEGNGTKIAAQ